MVQYNAFNVDPLRYQQAGMGNIMGAMQHRDNMAQSQDRNALYSRSLDQGQAQHEANLGLREREFTDRRSERTELRADRKASEEEQRSLQQQKNLLTSMGAAIESGKPIEYLSTIQKAAGDMFPKDFKIADYEGLEKLVPGMPGSVIYKGNPKAPIKVSGETGSISKFLAIVESTKIESGAQLMEIAEQTGVSLEEMELKTEKGEKPEAYKPDVFSSESAKLIAKEINDIEGSIRSGYELDVDGMQVPLTPQRIQELQNEIGIKTRHATSLATGKPPSYPSRMFGNFKDDPIGFVEKVETYDDLGYFNHPETREQIRGWLLDARSVHQKQTEEAQKAAAKAAEKAEVAAGVAQLGKDLRRGARGTSQNRDVGPDAYQPRLSPLGQKASEVVGNAMDYGRQDRTPQDLAVDPNVLSGEGVLNIERRRQQGKRDKTAPGWLGTLKRPDGGESTEVSMGFVIGGKETEIPLLVPGLTKAEIDYILNMGDDDSPTPAIVKKAIEHAQKRIKEGKSPFKE